MSHRDFISPPGAKARYASLDVARGIIMVVMALDHASAYWNVNRPFLEGLPGVPPIEYASIGQQITREITHICAPGFQLLAGMGLSISVLRRQARGVSEWAISGDMILRGLILCLCDFVLMYFAYGMVPLFFVVLAAIGCSIIIFSAARKLPLIVIALLAAAVVFAGPWYAPKSIGLPSMASYPADVFYNIVLPFADEALMAYWVLYPIFPWVGCFALGWCLGMLYERRRDDALISLASVGVAMMTAAFFLRWFGGTYADSLPIGDGPMSAAFWAVSKYPPSPVFLLATLGAMLVMLGLLRRLDARESLGGTWRLLIVYGRVALFFFVVHMYVYLAYPQATGTMKQYNLRTVYAVWIAGLFVMFPLCLAYYRGRIRWPKVLRYF